MTALNSGLHFLSGIALYFGALPVLADDRPAARRPRRRQQGQVAGYRRTPLSERQKKELLDSIRKDDWFE